MSAHSLIGSLALVTFIGAGPASRPEGAQGDVQAAKGPRAKVAVLGVSALGMSTGMRESLDRLLQSSIATIDGVQLISALEVQMATQDPKNRAVAACGGGPECAVRMGKLVGADRVIFGTVTSLGQSFSLNLRLMDVAKASEITRQSASISGNRNLLIPEVRLAAYRLLAPERIRGSLLIEIDLPGVEIELDGQKVGVTPLDRPLDSLVPGPHVVVLRRPGYSELKQQLTIKPFETARLKIELAKAR